MKVQVKKSAEIKIEELHNYIAANGNPLNAANYFAKISAFVISLGQYHNAYSICKEKTWKKRNWKCAVFDKKYIIAFKVNKSSIVIHKFIHGSMQKHT